MFLEKCHGPHVTYTHYIPNVSFTWTHGSWGDSVLNVSSTYPVCILNVSWWTHLPGRISETYRPLYSLFSTIKCRLICGYGPWFQGHVELTLNFTFSLRSVYVIGIGSCKFYVFNDTFMFPPYFLPALVVLNPDNIYHKMAGSTGIRMDRTTAFFSLLGGYYWNVIWLIPFFW